MWWQKQDTMSYPSAVSHMRRKGCSDHSGDAMQMKSFQGILIPFLGTTLGSACMLFMKKRLNQMVQRVLTEFAADVMAAASISI